MALAGAIEAYCQEQRKQYIRIIYESDCPNDNPKMYNTKCLIGNLGIFENTAYNNIKRGVNCYYGNSPNFGMNKLKSTLLPKSRPDLSKASAYKVFDWWLEGWHYVIAFFFIYLFLYAAIVGSLGNMQILLAVPVGLIALIVIFAYLIAPLFELLCRSIGWPTDEIERLAPVAKRWAVSLSVGGVVAFSILCILLDAF